MRIVFPGLDWSQKEHQLTAERLHYCVHVHRMQSGDQVYVSDGAGRGALFVLFLRDDQYYLKQMTETDEQDNIAPVRLFYGIPKGDKLDRVVRQLSELGIAEICLVRFERNVVKLEGPRLEKRLERLKRIATEAARQSERSSVMTISGVYDIRDALELTHPSGFFLDPTSHQSLPNLETNDPVDLFVGPEGGFSTSERTTMTKFGLRDARVGETILRTETAALVACTVALSRMCRI